MLEFDADTTALLEDAYQGADFARRRRASFDVLDPVAGETILDIGSGPGHLLLDIARAVGPKGRAIGVDPSAPMRAAAQRMTEGRANIEMFEAVALDLPFDDGTIDKAVSVQVFEYLDDLPAALRESARAIRPGGRLVVSDMHFDTFAWSSDEPARMNRMMRAWDHHLVHKALPADLPRLGRAAGFEVERILPVTFVDHKMRPGGLAWMMLTLMERYAIANDLLPMAEAKAWAAEQSSRAAEGRFYFAITHIVTALRRI